MNEENNFRIFFHSLVFGSFNGGNGKFIQLFRSLSMRKWNG